MISYTETPLEEIHDEVLLRAGVRLLIKREDMNHPEVSGNKWWKLKYNLEEAVSQNHRTLLTFGGSYSNHLYAVAGAASNLGLKSIGIVRGEEALPLNATLAYARSRGMELHYVTRECYREKSGEAFLEELKIKFGDFYLLPEGGTNSLAVKGCRAFGEKIVEEIDFDYLCLAVGTGGTFAGIVSALRDGQQAVGFSVLKNGAFLEEHVRQWIGPERVSPWRIETGYHFGGYAKTTPELMQFISNQHVKNSLPLDKVYTAKTLYGILDLISQGGIRRGCTVLMVHTGGLQGTVSTK